MEISFWFFTIKAMSPCHIQERLVAIHTAANSDPALSGEGKKSTQDRKDIILLNSSLIWEQQIGNYKYINANSICTGRARYD